MKTPEELGRDFYNIILNFKSITRKRPYFGYIKKIKNRFYRFEFFNETSFGVYSNFPVSAVECLFVRFITIDNENFVFLETGGNRFECQFKIPPKNVFFMCLFEQLHQCLKYRKLYFYDLLFAELNEHIFDYI